MRKKKSLILLLVFILVLQSLTVFAAYDGGSYIKDSETWESYKDYYGLADDLPFEIYYKSNQIYFNKELWEELGLVVYGDYTIVNPQERDFKQVPGGYYTKNGIAGEYRYHGVDKSGNKVNNINFPDDAVGPSVAEDKSWIYDPWSSSSPAYLSFFRNIGDKKSEYNEEALKGITDAAQTIKKWINEGLDFNINHGIIDDDGTNHYQQNLP